MQINSIHTSKTIRRMKQLPFVLLIFCFSINLVACQKEIKSQISEIESQSETQRVTQSQMESQAQTESQPETSTELSSDEVDYSGIVTKNFKSVEKVMPIGFTFVDAETKKEYNIYNYDLTQEGEKAEDQLSWREYAYADLDQDGEIELIIRIVPREYNLVLHKIEDTFYGYRLSFRTIIDIYEDGLSEGSSGASYSSGGRFVFTTDGATSVDEWVMNNDKYYLYGREVSKDEFDTYMDERSEIKKVLFHSF